MIEVENRVDSNGTTWYYKKGTGIPHREDGPAVLSPFGGKMWYQNGKFHREDGPAVEFKDGYKLWYLNGEQVTEEDVMYDKVVDASGTTCYYKKGTEILHRENGPAIEYTDGSKFWYLNGEEVDEDVLEEYVA